MLNLSYDLHIHSCLSPCGDADMLPSNIIGMAALKGLDVIAVTDHNSCKNCPAVMKLASEYNLIAIAGMEICTEEEVHVLCLFPSLEDALAFDEIVHKLLPEINNKPEIFGEQLICDADDNILSHEPWLLINAVRIQFDDLYDYVSKHSGIMIPAHIEKPANSLFSNLGFIPPDSRFTCAEVKNPAIVNELKAKHPYLENCNIINNSDAHYLHHIHEPVNFISCEDNSVKSILKALNTPPRLK